MMNKFFRKATGLVLAATMTASMGVCATAYAAEESKVISDKEMTLTMMTYYEGENDEVNQFAYGKVKEYFPNVTIEFEAQPQDGGQTIKTRAATGDLPDILQSDSGTLMLLAESGSILPLDEYIEAWNYTDCLVQSAAEICLTSPDGHVYQFPIGGIAPILWYYNKAIFAECGVEVPTNYDELLEAVKAFTEQGVTPLALFGKEPWPLGAMFDSFAFRANGNGVYALSEGEAKASDEGYAKAIEKLAALVEAGMFQSGCTNADFDTASAMFLEGQSAMFLNGDWYISDADPALGENLGVFECYPTGDAGAEDVNQYATLVTGDTCGLTVTTKAEDPELCAMIAAIYAYNRQIAEYQIKNAVTVGVKTDGLDTNSPMCAATEQLLEMMPNIQPGSKFLHVLPNAEFATSFAEEMQKLLAGESAEEFIANVDKCIESTVE